jgi:hypothetical protein
MNLADLEMLRERVARLSVALGKNAGEGAHWSFVTDEGETHRYRFRNIRSHEQVEDDTANLLVWVWSLKDHLKALARKHGSDPRAIEELANEDPHLRLCGELANLLKHGHARRPSPYGRLSLGRAHYEFGAKAIRSVEYRAFEVDFDIAHPELVEVTIPVRDENGAVIGDALESARQGAARWGELYDALKTTDS